MNAERMIALMMLPFEIVAVRFNFFRPCSALFVCPTCGLLRSDSESGRHNLSGQIIAFDRLLSIEARVSVDA
jgi:hypothetical protein